MWNVRGLRLFGLVACMAVALVFTGASQLDAKKPPKPPQIQWQVAIPDENTAGEEGCNLYGNGSSGYVEYENNEAVEVDVFTNVDPETGKSTTRFTLKIAEPGSIGFRDLDFQGCRTYCLEGGEGPCTCQVFPDSDPDGSDCCEVNCCSRNDPDCEATGYVDMKSFMEGPLHPTEGYDSFNLRFIVHEDIEAIPEPSFNAQGELEIHSWTGEADLVWLNLWNTDEILVEGNNDEHNIVCAYWRPLEDVVVERLGADGWKVTVDQCGWEGEENCPENDYGYSEQYIVFWETYYQGIWKPKGKSGKFSLDSEYRWALGGAIPFKFITKWTRK
jgi:hypothetical protein